MQSNDNGDIMNEIIITAYIFCKFDDKSIIFQCKKNNRQNKSFNNNKIKTTTTTKTKKLKDMILYVFELIILNKIVFFVKVLLLDVGNGYIVIFIPYLMHHLPFYQLLVTHITRSIMFLI